MNTATDDRPPSLEEVYQALLRSLRRRKGFGILFVQCSPAQATQLIRQVKEDLPQKKIEVLQLTEPIDNLYNLIADRGDRHDLNILFIQGIEKSLEPYIEPGFGGDGDYYNLNTVPRILSHLNQQRERFRDDFPNLCFVFIVPLFALKYFVRRAPDFFDWRSGVFVVQETLDQIKQSTSKIALANWDDYVNLTSEERRGRVFAIEELLEIDSLELKALLFLQLGLLCHSAKQYEDAIAFYDKAIELRPGYSRAWELQGNALRDLGRYEDAIGSYNEVIQIQPDRSTVWLSRGKALLDLERYDEANKSIEHALSLDPNNEQIREIQDTLSDLLRELPYLKPKEYLKHLENLLACLDYVKLNFDDDKGWKTLGTALSAIEELEDKIEKNSDSTAASTSKLDRRHILWGHILYRSGKYKEAISIYNKIIESNPNSHASYYNKACCYGLQGNAEQAIESLQRAIELDPKNREMAKTDKDFDAIRDNDAFRALVGE